MFQTLGELITVVRDGSLLVTIREARQLVADVKTLLVDPDAAAVITEAKELLAGLQSTEQTTSVDTTV